MQSDLSTKVSKPAPSIRPTVPLGHGAIPKIANLTQTLDTKLKPPNLFNSFGTNQTTRNGDSLALISVSLGTVAFFS